MGSCSAGEVWVKKHLVNHHCANSGAGKVLGGKKKRQIITTCPMNRASYGKSVTSRKNGMKGYPGCIDEVL